MTTTIDNVGVTDNKIAVVSCPDSSLAPGASETCTGSYTVTQADVDAGSVTNTATAAGTNPDDHSVSSGSSSVTVDASKATSSLSLVKSTTSSGYGSAGQVISYSYMVTNTGTTTLSSVSVNDNLVASVICPSVSLAPGASETCSGSYTVTQANVDNGSVTNTATASALTPADNPVASANARRSPSTPTRRPPRLSLVKSTDSTGYGAAGDTIDYSYLVTNTGTTTLSGVGVSDNKVASVSCPPAHPRSRSVGDLHRQLHRDPGQRGQRLGDQHGHRQRHRTLVQCGEFELVDGHGRCVPGHVGAESFEDDQLERVQQSR